MYLYVFYICFSWFIDKCILEFIHIFLFSSLKSYVAFLFVEWILIDCLCVCVSVLVAESRRWWWWWCWCLGGGVPFLRAVLSTPFSCCVHCCVFSVCVCSRGWLFLGFLLAFVTPFSSTGKPQQQLQFVPLFPSLKYECVLNCFKIIAIKFVVPFKNWTSSLAELYMYLCILKCISDIAIRK